MSPHFTSHASLARQESPKWNQEFIHEIEQALIKHDAEFIHTHVVPLHVGDIATLMEFLHPEHEKHLALLLPPLLYPSLLKAIDDRQIRLSIMEAIGWNDTAEAIASMKLDDAVQILENLERSQQMLLLSLLPFELKTTLQEILSYPTDSAGRLYERRWVSVLPNWTVEQTVAYMQAHTALPLDFYQIFVVDDALKPVGSIFVSRILLSEKTDKMHDIMDSNVQLIPIGMDQEKVAWIFHKYRLASAPVINEDGAMIGIIDMEDIVDVIKEEAEEDILRMGGIYSADMHSSPVRTAKKRFPWIFVNLLTALQTAHIIHFFEGTIEEKVALAALMPIAASIGGNAGTQVMTVMIRILARSNAIPPNLLRFVIKETGVGAINALLFSILGGACVHFLFGETDLTLVFVLSIAINLVFAGMIGCLIPLSMHRLSIDPAIASGVFLTACTDIMGYVCLLGCAAWLL